VLPYGTLVFYFSGTSRDDRLKWKGVPRAETVRDYIWALREALASGIEPPQPPSVGDSGSELTYRFRSRSGEPFPLSQREQESERLSLLLHDYLDAKASGERNWKNDFSDTLEQLRGILADYSHPTPMTDIEKTQYKIRYLFDQYESSNDPVDRAQWAREIKKERETPVERRIDDRGDNPELNYPDWIPKAEHHLLSATLKAWSGIDYAYFSYLLAREAVAEELARSHTEGGIKYLTGIVERKIELLDNTARRYLAGELEDKPPHAVSERSGTDKEELSKPNDEKSASETKPTAERRFENREDADKAVWSDGHDEALMHLDIAMPFTKSELGQRYNDKIRIAKATEIEQIKRDYATLLPFAI